MVIKLEHLFLASNDRTFNFEPNRAFTKFTKLLFELTQTSIFLTSNEIERVHLLVIELQHHIFDFERLNIELRTLFDPSLDLASRLELSKLHLQFRLKQLFYRLPQIQLLQVLHFSLAAKITNC